jgi:acyl carrier protein
MKKMDENKFLKILKKVIGSNIHLSMGTEIAKIKKWDSLNNIRIILELNKLLKKKINFNDLDKIKKISDLYKKINKKYI